MSSIYGLALKRVLDAGVPPKIAVERLVAYLTHHARTRDIARALKTAHSLAMKESAQNSVLVTEAISHHISDTAARKAINAPATTPVIRTTDSTLSYGWILQYKGMRVDTSAKHQLHTWYQTTQTHL